MNTGTDTDTNTPVIAAVFMLLGVVVGTALDNTAKWVLAAYPLAVFIFLRSVTAGLMMILISVVLRRGAWRTRRLGWHVLRTLLVALTMFGFFYGIQKLPLVDAVTLGFSAPIMIALLAVPLLGERIGWRRWLAILAGFAGVITVLRPGMGLLQPAALIVLASAFTYALLAISSRHLARTESTLTMALYMQFGPLLMSAPFALRYWTPPTPAQLGACVLAGVFAGATWLFTMAAFRRASPTILAPLEYVALVFNALTGYFVWREIPGSATTIGALIITASGLYLVYREYQVQKAHRGETTAVLDAEKETGVRPGHWS